MKIRDEHAHGVPTEEETRQDQLPELPADVAVPDDLSALEHADAEPAAPRPTAVRWLRWMAPLAILVIGAFALVAIVREATSDDVSGEITTEQTTTAAPTRGPNADLAPYFANRPQIEDKWPANPGMVPYWTMEADGTWPGDGVAPYWTTGPASTADPTTSDGAAAKWPPGDLTPVIVTESEARWPVGELDL